MKYYYKDKDGKIKKYAGKVIERDGKTFGILTKVIQSTDRKEVFPVEDKTQIASVNEYYTWKDLSGNEHVYDSSTDGKIFYDDEGNPYINKMLETKLNLIWHKGE